MKTTFDHVVLRVSDLDRSIIFYCDVMGFEPVGKRRQPEPRRVEQVVFRVGESQVLVLFHRADFEKDDPADMRGMDHLAFRVGDGEYEAILGRLAANGFTPHRGEERNLGALGIGYATYFYDPDGIELEIKRYDDPPEQPGPEWYAQELAGAPKRD